jgi:Zn-dependent membrane protease YugP
MPLGFDPLYFVFLAPGMLLAMWAQYRLKSAYAQGSQVPAGSGYSGAETASALLQAGGAGNVAIEPVEGYLSDHYDPSSKVLRLSPEVYSGRSLAALGIAAHETGHAYQDAQRYSLLVIRNAIVPLAGLGSNLAFIIIFAGFALSALQPALGRMVVYLGIAAFSLTVIFQLVNLPVEFDASRRARIALIENGLVTQEEDRVVKKVLSAAALTYVAATLTSILTLLYFLFRLGILGGSRRQG